MTSGPTQRAASADERQWQASPVAAVSIRALAVIIPFLVAWFVVTALSGSFYRPGGRLGIALWLGQSVVAGLSVSMTTERFTRRALPLASLFNMTLVFPDQAPSRFGVALRTGTVRRLESRSTELAASGLSGTVSEAAAQAVELVAMLSRHDRLTRGHTERVRAYSDLIGEEMGLSVAERGMLAWGALLHDVGKMKVSAEILNKDGRPNQQEWESLKQHPAAAAPLLLPLEGWLGEWLLAAPQHHERWDGQGYPLGLAGTDISLAGRIVAVADAYDVMTSRRSYKEAFSPESARQELIECAGTQFDPEVVRAFLNVSLRRRWLTGPLASLAELPGVINIGANLPAASAVMAGAVATVASVAAAPPQPTPADDLAFTTTVTSEAPVDPLLPPGPDPTRPEPVPVTGELPPDSSGPPASLSDDGQPLEATTVTSTAPADDGPSSSATTTTTTTSPGPGQPPTTGPPLTSGGDAPPTTGAPTTATTVPFTTTTTAAPTTTTAATTTTTAPTTTTTAPTTTTTAVALAFNDSITVEENKDERIHVLDNDDPSVDGGTLQIITPPQHAQDYRVHGDHIHYKSEKNYEGSDWLVYRVCDSGGTVCDTATVFITVED